MKIIIVGAGATYAEALGLNIEKDKLPPLMKNFSSQSQVWQNFNPHPFLDRFLEHLGYTVENEDGRELFYKLEREEKVNIEQFFHFCWIHREKSFDWSQNSKVRGELNSMSSLPRDFISGFNARIASESNAQIQPDSQDFWNNMLHHGFGLPFFKIMSDSFFENGTGIKELPLSRQVVNTLNPGDLVLNLNYDTVFELSLQQFKKNFVYCPDVDHTKIMVCKPHGSLNMVVSSNAFDFGQPEWWGSPSSSDLKWHSYIGLIPPRLDKEYEQNIASKMMIDSVKNFRPEEILLWGIGLTESDIDLINLFQGWSAHKPFVGVANPDKNIAKKVETMLSCNTVHYIKIEDWLDSKK